MTLLQLLILIVIAGICGAIGQTLGGYSRGGCVVSVALGFIGALLGGWLASLMGLPDIIFATEIGGVTFPILWSIIGAALFVAILGMISRSRK